LIDFGAGFPMKRLPTCSLAHGAIYESELLTTGFTHPRNGALDRLRNRMSPRIHKIRGRFLNRVVAGSIPAGAPIPGMPRMQAYPRLRTSWSLHGANRAGRVPSVRGIEPKHRVGTQVG
jgi:hypothetical protein